MTGHVLIIDPMPTNRIVLKAKLSSAHYKTTVAADLDEAYIAEAETPLEAVLIATSLFDQGEDTITAFLNQISRKPNHGVTVIFMRDDMPEASVPALVARCHAIGGHDCIARPLAPNVMLARLRNLMRDRARIHDLFSSSDETPLPNILKGKVGPRPGVRVAFASVGATPMAPTASTPWGQLSALTKALPAFDTLDKLPLATLLQPDVDGPSHGVMIIAASTDATEQAISLLSQLKSGSRAQATRLVLILDTPSPDQVARAFDLGADEALCSQTCTPEELADRIDHQAHLHCAEMARKTAVRDQLKLAITDPLTGLHNRRYATERLQAMQDECRSFGHELAVLAIDLDHFKQVNDKHGHTAGDLVLQRVASILNETVRGSDLVARIGGEEFLVALPKTDRLQAINAANRLRQAVADMETPLPGPKEPVRVTLSIGLAFQDNTGSLDEMLQRADRALYDAKAQGRNLVSISVEAA